MKKILISVAFMAMAAFASAQRVSKIEINRDGSFDKFYFLLDEGVTLTMGSDGNVIAWGVEVYSERNPTLSKLDTYPGRVEYYASTDNEAFRGKVKYIGKNLITYYASYDIEALRGKVKSIGTVMFDYYSQFDNDALKGKLKKAGSLQLDWYSTFDNEALRGKLKTAGTTNLNYYTSYDDKAIKGKIKSIDRASFTYYTSLERKEYVGAVKSGNQLQTINGIQYYVKF